MAFGSGALHAALSFELTVDAYSDGDLPAVAPGLAIGAALVEGGGIGWTFIAAVSRYQSSSRR